MRKSREETAATRQRIVESAAAQFLQNGIAATGLSDLMGAAGLTHGGFYRHFESKDQVVTESCAAALDSWADKIEAASTKSRSKRRGLASVAESYLSSEHRDDPAQRCPLAALGSELARSGEPTREVATEGLRRLINVIAAQMPDPGSKMASAHAITALSTMVGALTLSMIVTDRGLSDRILMEAKAHVSLLEAA